MDLINRRQVLINLISRVGRGQQNIYRWVDELMEIDAQLEQEETKKVTTDSYKYIIKFSDSEDYISDSSLARLAVLWEGVIKDGDILTNIYPEDFCDNRTYLPIRASWDDYVPKYSEIEAWEVPMPSEEEWQKAIQDPTFLSGKPYTKWLEATQPWTIVKFTAAHHEWREDYPGYSKESSDGYRSAGSGGGVKHYRVLIPDTWVWQSAAGTTAETLNENTPPKVFNKYTYQWYVDRVQTEYKDGYFARQRAWKENWKANKLSKTTKIAAQEAQEKAAKLVEKQKDSKGKAKHPLASKKACYPDLKKYFYSLYPELQEYEDYIQLNVGTFSASFECRIGTVTYEHELYGRELKDIFSFDENKKVDVVIAKEEALSRAKAFKAFADTKAKEALVKKEMLNLKVKKEQEYQAYKTLQKSKGLIIKPFEKWVQSVA